MANFLQDLANYFNGFRKPSGNQPSLMVSQAYANESIVPALTDATVTAGFVSGYCLGNGARTASLQINATGMGASGDAVMKIQESNDGVLWTDTGATQTIATGTHSYIIKVTAFTTQFLKVAYDKGTNNAGTIAAILYIK